MIALLGLHTRNPASLERFFAPLLSLPFSEAFAAKYGLLRADRRSQGKPIGADDLMIAAIARHHDAKVVTHSVDEFSRVASMTGTHRKAG